VDENESILALANTIYESTMNHSNPDMKNHSNHDTKFHFIRPSEGGQVSKKPLLIKLGELPPDEPRCPVGVTVAKKDNLLIKKLSPNYDNSIYDSLRASVSAILAVSSKFHLKSSRSKGVVLVCGSNDDEAKEAGFGSCFLPLKTSDPVEVRFYTDNPLIQALAQYARLQLGSSNYDDDKDKENALTVPELVLGLCCNNWGMY
jgi:hypothetical protein